MSKIAQLYRSHRTALFILAVGIALIAMTLSPLLLLKGHHYRQP